MILRIFRGLGICFLNTVKYMSFILNLLWKIIPRNYSVYLDTYLCL